MPGGDATGQEIAVNRLIQGTFIGAVLLAGVFIWTGVGDFNWPWKVIPDFTDVEVSIELPEEARIVAVEPIVLDCRARVHAEVPVQGSREHQLFGQTYRTDTVDMFAIGDVDTCVEGASADVFHRADGSVDVVIPGNSVVFVRPRVNTVETADSVKVTKGQLGKVTDIFPWVSDDLGLTPLAYAYAQNVIGSSQCMRTAFAVTEDVLTEAYRQQFIEQGFDPNKLSVTIDGSPDFFDPPPLDLGGADMSVGTDNITCIASDDLGGSSVSAP
jgi:hypothetical protein